MTMQDFGTTALAGTPSYALYLAEVGEKMGLDFSALPLPVGLFGGIEPHYLMVVDRVSGMDSLEIKNEVAEEIFSDIMADMVAFTGRVSDRLNGVLGLSARVTLVEPGTIQRSVGKAKHVTDLGSIE